MENSLALPQKVKNRFIMLYNFSCVKHYISTSVSHGMLTTKNLVSIHHHAHKPFYPFCSPLPSCNHSLSLSLFLFGLVYSFILSFTCMFACLVYSRCEWNHIVFIFLHLNYFYYAYYTLKESGGLHWHRVTKSRTGPKWLSTSRFIHVVTSGTIASFCDWVVYTMERIHTPHEPVILLHIPRRTENIFTQKLAHKCSHKSYSGYPKCESNPNSQPMNG